MTSKSDLNPIALEQNGTNGPYYSNEKGQLDTHYPKDMHDQQYGNDTVVSMETSKMLKFQEMTSNAVRSNKRLILRLILLGMFIGYTVYFAFAIKYSVKNATALIVITSLVVFWIGYRLFKHFLGHRIYRCCLGPAIRMFKRTWPCTKW